jgi:hypothetical protein
MSASRDKNEKSGYKQEKVMLESHGSSITFLKIQRTKPGGYRAPRVT